MRLTEREEAALADLRARHPDRPAYIHPFYGVPVVGPTAEEWTEVMELLHEDELEETAHLRDPKYVLAFIRECNGERFEKKARFLALHKRVKSVEQVIAVAARVRFKESTSEVIARIRTKDGKRAIVHATHGYSAGDFYEPPSEEGDVVRLTEEKLAELLATSDYEEVES